MKYRGFCAVWILFGCLSAWAQESFLPKPEIFDRVDVSVKGRIRHVVLADVFPGGGEEVVVVERRGKYPNWKTFLSVFEVQAKGLKVHAKTETELPFDALYFAPLPKEISSTPAFVLVRSGGVDVWSWKEKGFERESSPALRFDEPFPALENGNVAPLDLVTHSGGFFLPSPKGLIHVKLDSRRLVQTAEFSIPPKGFYRSSTNARPFDLPFFARTSFWYPRVVKGDSKDPGSPVFFLPWMDEVTRISGSGSEKQEFFFDQLTEEERDDGQSYVVTFPRDLNGDGVTDFLVNKFKGSVTSLQAEARIFMSDVRGQPAKEGLLLKPEGNRTAGAFPVDFDVDGRVDLAVVSAQYNVWAVIKALLQKQITVHFALYRYGENGYPKQADWTRDISFSFNLQDGEVDGLYPTLEGDFNGDGKPDALYARNRRELTVLVQKDRSYPEVPTGTYKVTVPRFLKIGHLNGDAKSDIVLFDTRSGSNQKLTFLFATSLLK